MDARGRDRANYALPGETGAVERWTPARKEEAVRRYEAGELDLDDFLARNSMAPEEFEAWRRAFNRRGRRGLRVGAIQHQVPEAR